MKKVILAGNAITAEILISYVVKDERYKLLGLMVDDQYINDSGVQGLDCIALSQLRDKYGPEDCSVIMAIGYGNINRGRESMFLRLKRWAIKSKHIFIQTQKYIQIIC